MQPIGDYAVGLNMKADPYLSAMDKVTKANDKVYNEYRKQNMDSIKNTEKYAEQIKQLELKQLEAKQKAIQASIKATEKEYKARIAQVEAGTAEAYKLEKSYYEKLERLQAQSVANEKRYNATRRKMGAESLEERARRMENFGTITDSVMKGNVAGLTSFLGPAAGFAGIAIDAFGALKDKFNELAAAGNELNRVEEKFGAALKMANPGLETSAAQIDIITKQIYALQRPLGVTETDVLKLATGLAKIAPTDEIKGLTKDILDIKRISGDIDLSAFVENAGDFIELGGSMDLLVASAKAADADFKSLGSTMAGTLAQTASSFTPFMASGEAALKEASALTVAFSELGHISLEQSSKELQFMGKSINQLVNASPEKLQEFLQKLPAGTSAASIGLEKGAVSVEKFVSSMLEMGPAANEALASIQRGDKIVQSLQRLEEGGAGFKDFVAQFDDVAGTAAQTAALMKPAADKYREISETFSGNVMAHVSKQFGELADGAAKAGAGFVEFLGSADMAEFARNMGGPFESILDFFIDSQIEAERALNQFRAMRDVSTAFDALNASFENLSGQDYINSITSNMDKILNAGGPAAQEVAKLASAANAADPANIEAIKNYMQEISETKAAESLIALEGANAALGEALKDLSEESTPWYAEIASGFTTVFGGMAGMSGEVEAAFTDSWAQMKAQAQAGREQITKDIEALKAGRERSQMSKEEQTELNELIAKRQELFIELNEYSAKEQELYEKSIHFAQEFNDINKDTMTDEARRAELTDYLNSNLALQPETLAKVLENVDEIVAGQEIQLTATEDTVTAQDDLLAAKEQEIQLGQDALAVVDATLAGLEAQGITIDANTEVEIRQLEAKRAQLQAIIEQRKIEHAAILDSIKAIKAGADADNVRLELANKIAQAESQIAKIKAGEQKEATMIEKVQTGSLDQLAKEVAADITRFEKGLGDIDKRIGALRSGKGVGGGGGGRAGRSDADKEAEKAAKDAENRAKQLAKIEEDRIKALEKIAQEEEKLASDRRKSEIKEWFDERKQAQERIEAQEKLTKELIKLSETIRNQVLGAIDASINKIDSILARYRDASAQLMKLIGSEQAQNQQQIDAFHKQVTDLESERAEILSRRQAETDTLAAAQRNVNRSTREVDSLHNMIVQSQRELAEATAAQARAGVTAPGQMDAERAAIQAQIDALKRFSEASASQIAASASQSDALRNFLIEQGIAQKEGNKITMQVGEEIIDLTRTTTQEVQQVQSALAARIQGHEQSLTQVGQSQGLAAAQRTSAVAELTRQIQELQLQEEEAKTTQQGYNKELSDAQEIAEKTAEALSAVEQRLRATRESMSGLDVVKSIQDINVVAIGVDNIFTRLKEQRDLIGTILASTDLKEVANSVDKMQGLISENDIKLLFDFTELLKSADFEAQYAGLSDEQKEVIDGVRELIDETSTLYKTTLNATLTGKETYLDQASALKTLSDTASDAASIMDEMNKMADDARQVSSTTRATEALQKQRAVLGKQIAAFNQLRRVSHVFTQEQMDSEKSVREAYTALGEEITGQTGRIAAAFKADLQSAVAAVNGAISQVSQGVDFIKALKSGETGEPLARRTVDLVAAAGAALLEAPYPLNIIGAFLSVGSAIAKAIIDIAALFEEKSLSRQQNAELTAQHETTILQIYQGQIGFLQTLSALGDERVDQARETAEFMREQLETQIEQSAHLRRLNELDDRSLADRTRHLTTQKSLVDDYINTIQTYIDSASSQERRGLLQDLRQDPLFRSLGIQIGERGFAIDILKDLLSDLQLKNVQLNGDIEAGNALLQARAEILAAENASLDEQIALLELRKRLGQAEIDTLKSIEEMRRVAVLDALESLFEAQSQGLLKTGVTLARDLATLTDKELKDLILTLTSDTGASQISPQILAIITSWLDATDAVTAYNTAQGEALETSEEIFDREKRLLKLRLDAGKIDESEYNSRLLALLQSRLVALQQIGATEEEILSIEAEIYALTRETADENWRNNRAVADAVSHYQNLRNQLLAIRAMGGDETLTAAQLAAARQQIIAQMTAAGATADEIQTLLDSLPQFEAGGHNPTEGPKYLHKDEYVISADAVRSWGRRFFDLINSIGAAAGISNPILHSPAARTLAAAQSIGPQVVIQIGDVYVTLNNQFANADRNAATILTNGFASSVESVIDRALRARRIDPNAGGAL